MFSISFCSLFFGLAGFLFLFSLLRLHHHTNHERQNADEARKDAHEREEVYSLVTVGSTLGHGRLFSGK